MALKEENEIIDLLERYANYRGVNDKVGLYYKGKLVHIGGKALYKSEAVVRMILKNNIYMGMKSSAEKAEYDKAIDNLLALRIIEIKPI